MPKATKKRKVENDRDEGSGNVFADLELKDSDELFARAKLGFRVYQLLQAKNLKQRDAASQAVAARMQPVLRAKLRAKQQPLLSS